MVKNLKKTLALMLSIIMILSSTMTIFADDEGIIGSDEAGASAQIEETVEAEAPTETPEVETPTQEQEAEAVTEAQQSSVEPEITGQPEDTSVYVNAEAEFALEVNGKVKSCQWQMAKTRNGAWSNLSRRQYGSSEILKICAAKKYNKRFFRCIVTFDDGTTALSEEAQLKIVEKNVYPAQNFGSLKDTKVVAPEGAFPAGTTMEANEVADTEAVQSIIDDMDGMEGEVLAAVDISFYDGNAEIQPQEAVKVTMNVGKDVNFEELTLVHIKANADELDKDNLETETVDFTYDEEAGTITFDAEHFSTFTITWRDRNSYRATVHYVDERGNELNISNPSSTYPNIDNNDFSPAYLIYDIDGYEYSYTYRNTDATNNRIMPYLERGHNYNNRWYYTTSTGNNPTWIELSNNDNIYVVYNKKEDPTTGGTAVIDDATSSDWPQDSATPQFTKTSIHNSDGVTNTVSLSISGGEKDYEKSTKANVIVVFDRSGSMSYNMSGSQTSNVPVAQQRLTYAKTATNNMANTLLNGDISGVKMALVSFSTTASTVQGFTDNYSTFTSAVNDLTASGGTNWEQSLAIANRMAVDSDAATFIVFVTDGDPTFRMSRGDVANDSLDMYSSNNYPYHQFFRQYHVFGTGSSDNAGLNFDYAAEEVSSILANNKTFYAIGVSNDVTKVQNLVNEAGGGTAYLATDSTALEEAFESITQSIKTTLGFGDVQITDGITELSNVEMKVMQEVAPDSFTYYKVTSSGQTAWDPASEGCGLASYDSDTGAVTWNMGDGFQLEDGVTYMVTFKVWPSQDAYNLIADLNNGVKVYASGQSNSITDEEREQVQELKAPTATEQGSYTLKTNTDSVNATYSQTSSTGDTVTVSGQTGLTATYHEGTIEDMPLESMQLTIKKEFEDDLTGGEDRKPEVTLVMKRRSGHQANASDEAFVDYPVPQADGSMSPNIVLNETNHWTYSVYVAPGLQTGSDILETGYDFTITEPGIDYHYGLIEEIINPMVVDGRDRYYGDGYLLDDEATIQKYIDQSLTAVNRVKSGIDVKKVVVDDQGNEIFPDEEFTITGKILDPDGNPYTFNQEWDQRTDKSSTTWVPAEYDDHQNDSIAYHKYDKEGNRTIYKGHFDDTSNIQFTLKAGERIRFINVPENCTFEFSENTSSMSPDYDLDHADGVTQHKVAAESDEWTTEGDVQPVVIVNKDDNINKVYLAKEQEGDTGVAGNKQYVVTFTNKAVNGEWFYVYHSSDNTVEKIYTGDTDRENKVTRVYENGKYTYTFNITKEVKTSGDDVPSYLYGGYYKGFGGQSGTTSETQDAKDDRVRTLEYDDETNWATDEDATYAYTIDDKVKATAWKGANAYTSTNVGKGTEMHPVANGVYYLKEVPNSYLRPYIQVVYDRNDKTNPNKIVKLYQITALDDANYTQAGFYGGSGTEDKVSTQLSSTIKITDFENKTTTLTAKSVFDGKSYKDVPPDSNSIEMPRGYLTSIRNESYTSQFDMQPYFITLDGVKVYGVTNRTVIPGNGTFVDDGTGAGKIPGMTVSDVTNKKAVE